MNNNVYIGWTIAELEAEVNRRGIAVEIGRRLSRGYLLSLLRKNN